MESHPMVCRRLAESELEEWLKLSYDTAKSSQIPIDAIHKLADLEETIIYVASINGQFVGGTWLWRDKSRLSIALANVWIKPEYSAVALIQLLKSSLPWFKSLAIREVDALVYRQKSANNLPFHLNPFLKYWISDSLLTVGFKEIKSYYQLAIQRTIRNDHSFEFDIQKQPSSDWFQSVLRQYSISLDLDLSQASMILEFGVKNGTLFSFSKDGNIVLTTTLTAIDGSTIIGPLVYDPSITSPQQSIDIILNAELNFPSIIFSLLTNEQLEYLKSLSLGQSQFESEMGLLTRQY